MTTSVISARKVRMSQEGASPINENTVPVPGVVVELEPPQLKNRAASPIIKNRPTKRLNITCSLSLWSPAPGLGSYEAPARSSRITICVLPFRWPERRFGLSEPKPKLRDSEGLRKEYTPNLESVRKSGHHSLFGRQT